MKRDAIGGRLTNHGSAAQSLLRQSSSRQSSSRQSSQTSMEVAAEIRRALKDRGSAEHAAGVQWFFKDEIKSHGWYTAELRRAMRRCRLDILREHDLAFLVRVADKLFSGRVLEEKIAAVFLLEKMDTQFGDREFQLFES